MKPLSLDEIVSLDRYDDLRPAYREAVIRHKRDRRLAVGDRVTLVFEDHETLRFQVQEMCWIERIRDPEKVQAEIDVYNELLPQENELSATLFVEITDVPEIRPELDRLVGIDEHVSIALGDDVIRARFDPKQLEEDRISAVQYIRFVFSAEQARRFREDGGARIRIDHPNYRCDTEIPAAVQESLARGLSALPGTLLRVPEGSAVGRAADEILSETPRVRVYRPAHPVGPGHVVVEPADESADLLTAGPELLAEILDAVRAAAREMTARHGRCRVQTVAGPEAGRPRWHVLAPEE